MSDKKRDEEEITIVEDDDQNSYRKNRETRRIRNEKQAEEFSNEYFGKIVVGTEGSNARQFHTARQFGVVVKTDNSDPRSDLLVVSPAPFSLQPSWVKSSQYHFATEKEIEQLFSSSPKSNHEFQNGSLVELTEPIERRFRGSYVSYFPGDIAVVDNGDSKICAYCESEYGKDVRWTKTEFTLPDGRKLTNSQLINCSTLEEKTVIRFEDGFREIVVPVSYLKAKRLNLHALKRVIVQQAIKERLLAGMKWLDPVFRDTINQGWGLNRFDYGKGFLALFYGAPGVGKTSLSRSVAEQIGRPLFRLDASRLGADTEQFGNDLSEIMKITTRLNAILLIEEVDQILMKRTSHMHPTMLMKISEVLQIIEAYEGVLLMTSNRAFELDPAVYGRFNMIFEMPNLNESIREDIWLTSLPKELPIEGNLDVEKLSSMEIDGRAIKMSVFNAAGRAKAEGLQLVPATFFIEEAQNVMDGLSSLANDFKTHQFIDRLDHNE